jgi:tRNA pseudouridine38-40 synthase
MMTHWKLTLSYDGTTFHGWQVQPGLPTVQGTLAAAVESVTGDQVLPQGSGRTDAGVHALGQVASFTTKASIPPSNLMRALNHAMPPSIRVLNAEIAEPNFHARHCAIRKTYEYRIFVRNSGSDAEDRSASGVCPPFLAPYVWDCRWRLHPEAMQDAADVLLGTHDFTSFAASDPDLSQRSAQTTQANPMKTIYTSRLKRDGYGLTYLVTGSGFLHHMVRNIVGTLVEVGRGQWAVSDVHRIIAARNRRAAGPTAPPQGLFLVSVEYASSAGQPCSCIGSEASL